MLADERRAEILRLLEAAGSVSVKKLSEKFETSVVTIRHDLRRLEKQGLLERVHGGALIRHRTGIESTLSQRQRIEPTQKRRIAAHASHLAEDGDVVLLTDGSTTLALAHQLKLRPDVTMVTNSWSIMDEIGKEPSSQVILLGGMLRHVTMAFIGPMTLAALATLRVDKLFLGVDGLSREYGVSTPNMLECEVYRAMITSSKQVIVLADHTKIGREYLYQMGPIESIDTLVCDAMTPSAVVNELREAGVEVLVAPDQEED